METDFWLGQTVYLATDKEMSARLITQVSVSLGGIRYCLACGVSESWHYAEEICGDKKKSFIGFKNGKHD